MEETIPQMSQDAREETEAADRRRRLALAAKAAELLQNARPAT